jgi:ABC-type molybdate transport system substrate-binding protein
MGDTMSEISPPLRLFAAGSLRAALTDFVGAMSPEAVLAFGPAGLMRERIEQGDVPDLFLSANMAHPAALAAGRADGSVQCFARNSLVAVARRELGLATGNFLERLLSDGVRIGTSTPLLDPSGDYAQILFARAGAMRAGAQALLAGRARALVGGRDFASVPAGRYPARVFLESGEVDVFLTYLSNARSIGDEFDVVLPPPELAVTAEYGLIVLATEPARRQAASDLVAGLLSARGQAVLAYHGFRKIG